MEEDPQEHDFDQRHDGPFDQPRASIQLQDHRPSQDAQAPDHTARSPTAHAATSSTDPASPHEGRRSLHIFKGRKSLQYADRPEDSRSPSGGVPRTSTQMSREVGAPRPSEDFDIRRDGPFGRPSLTMTRRRSSGQPFPHASIGSPEGRAPTLEKHHEQASETGGEGKEGGEGGEAPHSLETLQSSTDAAFQPEPPPLDYDIWSRKWSIIFFWGLILIDCIAMPLVLYFCLWYYTDLSPNAVFSIVTAALGGISIFEYFIRLRRLWRKNSTCRVIGAERLYLDWFHWNFTLGWVIIMIELIV